MAVGVNRGAMVAVLPALPVGAILTLTLIGAPIGIPLLAVAVATLVLAGQGGVERARPATIEPRLPWALGAYTAVLLTALGAVAIFGGNDLDEPEEAVFSAIAVLWTVATGFLTVQAVRLRRR